MARFLATRRPLAATAALAASTALAAPAGAAMHVPSGDTCTVSGSGTAYSVVVNLSPNSPEQGAFALGIPGGAKITSLGVPEGSGGGGTTQGGRSLGTGLPAGTTAGWHLGNAAAVPGASVTLSLTTSAPAPGPFTLVPADATATTWFDRVVCQHPGGSVVPSSKFTPAKRATFDARTSTWRQLVTVPGPGTLNYVHRTLAAKGTPSPLVRSGRVTASKAGRVALVLRLSPAGAKALAASGRVKLDLNIQFSPKGGKPANKVVSLTLAK
jgi:hypothetical protein